MAVYETIMLDLSFLYPIDWTRGEAFQGKFSAMCEEATDCLGKVDSLLIVLEEDLTGLPVMQLEYLEFLLASIEDQVMNVDPVENFVTESG